MRTVHTDIIIDTIKDMCIEANYVLSDDISTRIISAEKNEDNVIGKQILGQLVTNMEIAKEEKIPICQDTGMATVFS